MTQHRQHRPWRRSNPRRICLRNLANAVLCTAVGICFVSSLAHGQSLGAFESPPVLRASDVLPQELLAGPYHRVDETVSNDGLSLLKTSYRTESLVFPLNAGYLLRHANDRLSPPRHSP